MAIVTGRHYRNGCKIADLELCAPQVAHDGPEDFVWIGLVDPTEDELRILQSIYNLHPLAVEDALQAHELPKVDVYGDQLFVTLRTARLEGEEIAYGETSLFLGRNHVITVRHGSNRTHTELRTQLEASPLLLKRGAAYVLYNIIDYVVDGYAPIARSIEDEVFEMEERVLESFLSQEEVAHLFRLRREIIKFKRILDPTMEAVRRLSVLELPCLDPESRPYYRNIVDHMRRVEGSIHSVRDVLTSVFEVGTLLEQKRQGDITRKLAAGASIVAVPTMISGFYGMNFKNMPELETEWGYPTVICVILVSIISLFFMFRRMKWI